MLSNVDSSARWKATFSDNANLSDLRAAVKQSDDRNPCVSGLRSICWKAFLLFGNLDKSTWTKTLSDSRSAYTSLKEHFLKTIEDSEDPITDPLADDEKSPWNILRQDEEIRAEIFQDVERCMPDNGYFREPSTQAMLLDILFIFCKLNRDVGYRQGMHEVLAPILWVISRDGIDTGSPPIDELDSIGSSQLLRTCLDQTYIEHDAFTLFAIVMQAVKAFYEVGSDQRSIPAGPIHCSPIVERSRRIHEYYLQLADPELAEHLTAIDILPQIFLIRWIRLLFGREFPLDEVLRVWDLLFAEDPALDLVDLICVSMLLRIRWQLLEADYSAALTLLLRYPVPEYPTRPSTFVGDALYLRQNLHLGGGAHIISKYSAKDPASLSDNPKQNTARSMRKGKRRSKASKSDSATAQSSPTRSPARFLLEQGGIDAIVQEAARGVYSQGERWGVAKVLRGVAQGLQSGNDSIRGLPDGSRWSLDYGKAVDTQPIQLTARIKALEERNKVLAKMLERAMADLWSQQSVLASKKEMAAADALSLAIAKVQFVQVYLDNPSMSVTPDSGPHHTPADTGPEGPLGLPETPRDDTDQSNNSYEATEAGVPTPSQPLSAEDAPPQSPRKPTNPKSRPVPVPFHQSRPSLAQSSFSWMLGQDQRKSSFVSASPLEPEMKRSKAFLFGDERNDSKGFSGGKASKASKGSKRKDRIEEDKEVFNLGTLKGPG